MTTNYFVFPNKILRTHAIKKYMEIYGYKRAVCFSCGNASRELKLAGVDTLDISPTGQLQALRWFTMGQIHDRFPDYFDATSGHLPMECMLMVADAFKSHFKGLDIPNEINLPTGSGETLVCLKLAFPTLKINAIYNLDGATEYNENAPLNDLVKLLAEKVVVIDGGKVEKTSN